MLGDMLRGVMDKIDGFLSFQSTDSSGDQLNDDVPDEIARLADFLPYDSYLPDERVFVNLDSLGFALELMPQTGADSSMVNILMSLYSGINKDISIQFHLFGSPHIKDKLVNYASQRMFDLDISDKASRWGRAARNDNIFRVLARRRVGYMLRGSQYSLVQGASFLLRDYRLVMSVSMPGNIDSRQRLEDLLALRDASIATLKSAEFPCKVWNADDLVNWVSDLLNPQRMLYERGRLTYDSGRLLREQMIEIDTISDTQRKHRILFGKAGKPETQLESRLYSIKSFPEKFGLWNMGGLIGDMFQTTLQYPCPFMITIGTMMLDPQSSKTGAITSNYRATREGKSEMAEIDPEKAEQKADWDKALKAIGRGERLVDLYHQVWLFGRQNEMQRAENSAKSLWQSRGFQLQLDACLQRQALIASLPMSLSVPFYRDLKKMKRVSTKSTGNAIHMSPLIGEWKGTTNSKGQQTPVLTFVGRRGQVMGVDLYDNENGGKNVAVVGKTGSGKSVLLQEIASSYASVGAKVWVMDKGRSFERLCHNVNGQYVRFIKGSGININPFSMVIDITEDMAMLRPVIAKMASPHAPLNPVAYGAVHDIIMYLWQKKGRAMTVTDFRDVAATGTTNPEDTTQRRDERITDLAKMIGPFCAGGAFGEYFNGTANIHFEKDFIVFETEDLKSNKDLRSVVQMIMLYKITQDMFHNRDRKKVFIMDEAKEALAGDGEDDEVMAEFVEDLYLRTRKYNGSAITASQSVDHYYSSKAAISAFQNSDFVFLLAQKPESVEALEHSKRMVMDENMKRLLNGLRTEEGVYSEVYIHTPMGSGVGRLVVDPWSLVMFSNRPQENVPLDLKIAAGMSIPDAIDELLLERGVTL